MDANIRAIIASKLGTIMIANAELAAENMELVRREKGYLDTIAALKVEVARLTEQSAQPSLELRAPASNGVGVH